MSLNDYVFRYERRAISAFNIIHARESPGPAETVLVLITTPASQPGSHRLVSQVAPPFWTILCR